MLVNRVSGNKGTLGGAVFAWAGKACGEDQMAHETPPCAGEKTEGGLKDGLANHWKSKNIIKRPALFVGKKPNGRSRRSARENDDPDHDIL